MRLPEISIRNPVFAWMIMASLLIFGALGFLRMGISQLPDVDYPVVSVNLTWEGAAPEVMETEILDPAEEAIMAVQGIKEISSSARRGQASISAEFELSKDIDVAVQEIQTRIAQAQRTLPKDIDPPVINKSNPEDQPILWLGLSGTRPTRELMEYTRDHLKDAFQTIPGVGEVFLGGYVEPALRVRLDAGKMAARELTVDDVLYAIQAQHAEVPAGRIETSKSEYSIRVLGEAATLDEFRRLTIPQRVGGGVLWKTFRLGQVAEIEDGLEDRRRISRILGQEAIGLGIRKQRGANAVAVGRAVKAKMNDLQKSLPEGMSLGVNADNTIFVEDSIHEMNVTLILAALLTALVCRLFLSSWASTFNILLAVPTSLGGAFMVAYFMGFTLNTITMLGLSLAIGIVVDDAIMVLENIVRHREMGKSRGLAALDGAVEITFAAIAASVAIAAIFLPVAFMRGITGKFFYQFGVVVSVAVGFSLLEAVTLTPMRASQFLEVPEEGEGQSGRFNRFLLALTQRYKSSLSWCLNRRWTVVFASTLFFAGSLFIGGLLRKEMSPSQDQSRLLVRLQTAQGSSMAFTDEVFKKAEAYVQSRPELDRYYSAIGGFGGGEVNSGMMFVTLKPPRSRPKDAAAGHRLSQQEFMGVLRKGLNGIPGVFRAVIIDLSQGGLTGGGRSLPVEASLRGPDWEKLGAFEMEIAKKLNETGLVTDLDTDYQTGVPEVKVVPDRDACAARGLTVDAIGRTIQAMIGGVRAGKYSRGGRRYDIRVNLQDKDRGSAGDISRIFVRNNRGELIRLSEVTKIQEKPTLLVINRKNRERAVGISANVPPGKSQTEALAALQKIAGEVLPDGYRVVFSGSSKTFQESFREFGLALLLGVAVAYMILGAQFNSFIHPFTVLLALPFSLSGALIGLWVTGQSVNMMSVIGILLLMGIVKKNSILLVDFTNQRRGEGLAPREALLEACPTRLRPILMTSLSTVAGALPAALALGPGAEARAPMAVAVIGGVLLSTFLTLYVVPCAYSLMVALESKRGRELLEELAKSRAS